MVRNVEADGRGCAGMFRMVDRNGEFAKPVRLEEQARAVHAVEKLSHCIR
jgi:hypothetical protein